MARECNNKENERTESHVKWDILDKLKLLENFDQDKFQEQLDKLSGLFEHIEKLENFTKELQLITDH